MIDSILRQRTRQLLGLRVTENLPKWLDVVDNLLQQRLEFSGDPSQLNMIDCSDRGERIHSGDFNEAVAAFLNDHIAKQDRANLAVKFNGSAGQWRALGAEDGVATAIDCEFSPQEITQVDFSEDCKMAPFRGLFGRSNGVLEAHRRGLGQIMH
jgi:hypothetical protein